MTRLSALPGGPITITPLRTYPVIRDLVTDVSANYGWVLHVPSFAPPDGLKPGEYRMAQADVDRGQEFRQCIKCWLCQDVCRVIRDHEDNKGVYARPRYFIRHAELDMHPLDTGDRRQALREAHGLGLCNITKCCTEVCPAGIKITDNAIIPMKERSADQRYDPLGGVLRSWRRRPGRTSPG
jgi:succinate dehydrogenase / fumarate reductase, iron-sulfur subunit